MLAYTPRLMLPHLKLRKMNCLDALMSEANFSAMRTRQLPRIIPSKLIGNSLLFPCRHLGKTEPQITGLKFSGN